MVAPPLLAKTNEKLPIAVSVFPPFEFVQDGEVTGIDTEIVTQVLERQGYTADIRILPWPRAQKYVQDGVMAATFSFTKNSDREKFYYFSDPLSVVKDVFFKRKNLEITWNSLDDLKDYRIGASNGYSYAPDFMKAIKDQKFKEVQILSGDNLELRQLHKLKNGRIDIFICEVSVCQYLIKTHGDEFEMINFIDKPIGEIRPFYIGFSKKWSGSKELVSQFNIELKKFSDEGKRNLIFEKYGVTNPFAQ